MSRYNRHIILSEIGQEGQARLSQARVLVIGAGGLGCPVLQYLTAAGIGTLGIIDFDAIEASNLQRQVLFGVSALGQNKAIIAKQRLQDLNPEITIKAYPEKLSRKNALELFAEYDIIVDGSDNFETRYIANDAAVITEKPLVYGAIYKFEGQVSVFNYKNGPSYRCLFPDPPQKDAVLNCSRIGVLGVLPGIIGTMQANEVLKLILGIGDVLTGKILYYNALTTHTTTLSLHRSMSEINKVLAAKDHFQNAGEKISCQHIIPEISIAAALQKKNVQFIDVREHHELPRIDTLNSIQIPLSILEHNLDKIEAKKENILFCQSGIRSKAAIALLQKHQIKNCFSLEGGVLAVIKQYKTTKIENT